jgi:hypothetical protein
MEPISSALFLATVTAPYVIEGGARAGAWLRRRFGTSTLPEVIAPLPESWKRWGGARPEVRGSPVNTILAVPGLRKVSGAVRAALLETASALAIPVDSLALIIERESGWNEKATNPLGAYGLIQLTKGAALPGFPDPSSVLGLDAIGQLAQVVIPYYQRQQGAAGSDPGRLYMLNFLPAFAGRPESFVLAAANDPATSKIYEANPGFDRAKRGSFTVGDVYDSIASVAKKANGERIAVDGRIFPAPAVSFPASASGSTQASPIRALVTPPPTTRTPPALPRPSRPAPTTAPTTSTETEPEESPPNPGAMFLGGRNATTGMPSFAGVDPSQLASPATLRERERPSEEGSDAGAELRASGPGADCPCGCGGTCGCGPSGEDHDHEHDDHDHGDEAIAALAAMFGGTSSGEPAESLDALAAALGTGAPSALVESPDPLAALFASSAQASTEADPLDAFAAELTAAGCGCGGPRIAPDAYARVLRAAGPGGATSARGLLLQAHRAGQLEPIAWTEVPVPELGVIVTVALDALRAKVDGRSLRLPVSYAEQREIARDFGMLSPTKEIVDAVHAHAAHVEPIGLYNIAEQRGIPLDSLELVLMLNDNVDRAIAAAGLGPDALVRPLGKTWIVHPRITVKGAVNYGWHTRAGSVLQSPGARHDPDHVDYSQLAQDLVSRSARDIATGETVDLLDVYRTRYPELASDLELYA